VLVCRGLARRRRPLSVTLKALTYSPTGAIATAPAASLPERLGGVRNWDYRYCWVRDATFTLYASRMAGYDSEARAWRDWLLRAAAGEPSQLQIMHGVGGERRVSDLELRPRRGAPRVPVVAVPAAPKGALPVGVQLIGPWGSDSALLELATRLSLGA
jgi:hypothetical protein